MSQDVKKIMHDMQDRIREVAYLMWESAGRQHGMATEYWHAAEREVRAAFEAAHDKMRPSSAAKQEAKAPAPQAEASPSKAEAKAPAPAPQAQPPAPKEEAKAPVAPAPQPKPAAAAPSTPAAKSQPKAAAPQAKPASKPAPASKRAAKPTAAAGKAPAKTAAATGGYKTEKIEGIGPAYARKLAALGIQTTDDLLDRCGSAKGRAAVADDAGINTQLLLRWVNMADLMRVSGVGGEFAELLEAAGVDTVKELKTRKADTLAAKMAEVNQQKKLTRRVASAVQVAKWVEQAKTLEPKITH